MDNRFELVMGKRGTAISGPGSLLVNLGDPLLLEIQSLETVSQRLESGEGYWLGEGLTAKLEESQLLLLLAPKTTAHAKKKCDQPFLSSFEGKSCVLALDSVFAIFEFTRYSRGAINAAASKNFSGFCGGRPFAQFFRAYELSFFCIDGLFS